MNIYERIRKLRIESGMSQDDLARAMGYKDRSMITKKFHKPTCSSVKQMKESNKIYFTGSREDVIADGYEPCGRCYP